MIYIFILDPVSKPRMTRADRWKKRPAVMRYWAFAEELRLLANKEGFKLQESSMSIMFYLPMPKSWSKKKALKTYDTPHQQKPDIDNLLKAFFDALTEDDSFIWQLEHVEKRWGSRGCISVKTT